MLGFILRYAALSSALALAGAALHAAHQPDHPPEWQKGITFAHLYRPHQNLVSQRSTESLRYLRSRVNVEWIALTPFAYQSTYDLPNLSLGSDPPDDHLRRAIADAHAMGLKVMLKPHIWLRDQSAERWRGTIGMRTEEDWQAWFRNYERVILHYAALAADTDVELFCVGVELARTTLEREENWRRVISRVRERYDGPLVYAANWLEEYEDIPFWDAVDYVGINAFFPLSDAPGPSLDELRRRARMVAQEVELVHLHTGKPVIFTEVGFKSVPGTAVRPWLWSRGSDRTVDLEEQTRCYQAILEVFWDKPWFYGIYWWKWFSDMSRGGSHHSGFTPQHKPAEEILAEWYGRSRRY